MQISRDPHRGGHTQIDLVLFNSTLDILHSRWWSTDTNYLAEQLDIIFGFDSIQTQATRDSLSLSLSLSLSISLCIYIASRYVNLHGDQQCECPTGTILTIDHWSI